MSDPHSEDLFRSDLRRRTRRGFAGAIAALGAGALGWTWLVRSPKDGRINRALRGGLELHERVGRAVFQAGRLAPSYPRSLAKMPRVNGMIGMDTPLDLENWRLRVEGGGGESNGHSFTLEQLRQLPRTEVITELKCVEGWSVITQFAGVRLRDLAAATGLASRTGRIGDPMKDQADLFAYAALSTPDGGYYVGLDMPSALHEQTLLCDEMDGKPLPPEHGAPIRLFTPVKYGYKSIKRVGTIRFSDRRPPDFWAEQGYDWYAGL